MTIRKRLILSYIAMVLIPVILFMAVTLAVIGLFFGDWNGDLKPDNHFGHDNMRMIGETMGNREQLFSNVKYLANYEPDLLADESYLLETDEAFNGLEAGLVVARDDGILYASPLVEGPGLYEQLANYKPGWNAKINDRFTVEKHDFAFGDQSAGTIYLLSDMTPLIDRMQQLFPILFLSLLLIIGLTNGLLTYLVSKSIIKPLRLLKTAAEQIKEGNLDQALALGRKDEFGKVGEAFEEMRERLRESIRLQLQYEENRKELISNISHDLKTPITGIKACIEGLRDGIADTEKKRDKYMEMIDKKTGDMDRLIDELFLFSKLDLKRLPFHFERIDIAAYMEDCARELGIDPHMKDAAFRFIYDGPRPLYVMADLEKLQRVMMNIVNNSVKYMPGEDKRVELSLLRGAEEATVSIRDYGPGIEKEALPHIFDRFYRADQSRNSATGGSGLGLAIVKQIVEAHGGRTWADSAPGLGTTISFTLPMAEKAGGESE
ncbi:sensor histidine kinase [Paenibacillus arenilitoris]|uniref:histidine kinase n=1 Tax=Paenibacillus arenilitoris TaxID=2772299 RepID=A0A927CHL1_9BACL|nr:HAMP domain-containing sensor histidine kinase [Paenibacillus arenilitoris]MBD2867177.1 HAMP domain-containing histidine kinase [Paenibacillus arenilitoris]